MEGGGELGQPQGGGRSGGGMDVRGHEGMQGVHDLGREWDVPGEGLGGPGWEPQQEEGGTEQEGR